MRNLWKPIGMIVVAAIVGTNTAMAGGGYGGHARGHLGYERHGLTHYGPKHHGIKRYGRRHRHSRYGHRHRHSDGDVGLALGFGLLFGTLLGHALREPRYYEPPRGYRYYRPPRYYGDPRYDYGYRRPRVIHREYRTATPSYRGGESSGPCLQQREYQAKIIVGGREVDAYGTACLQPDGSWRRGAATRVPDYQ